MNGSRPHPVQLVTWSGLPDASAADRVLMGQLAQHGIPAAAVVWDDRDAIWSTGLSVMRSAWDYHLHVEAFRSWLDDRVAQRDAVANPPQVMKWNVDKRYLLEFADAGIAIPDTQDVTPEAYPDVGAVFAAAGRPRAVLKPAIGASAYGVTLVDSPAAARDVPLRQTMLLQAL